MKKLAPIILLSLSLVSCSHFGKHTRSIASENSFGSIVFKNSEKDIQVTISSRSLLDDEQVDEDFPAKTKFFFLEDSLGTERIFDDIFIYSYSGKLDDMRLMNCSERFCKYDTFTYKKKSRDFLDISLASFTRRHSLKLKQKNELKKILKTLYRSGGVRISDESHYNTLKEFFIYVRSIRTIR